VAALHEIAGYNMKPDASCSSRFSFSLLMAFAMIAIVQISTRGQSTSSPSDDAFQTFRTKGDERLKAGDFDAAMTLYDAAKSLRPDDIHIHFRLATTALQLKDRARGLDEVATMTMLNPKVGNNSDFIKLKSALEALSPANQNGPTQIPATNPASSNGKVALAIKTAQLIVDQMKLPANQNRPDVQQGLAREAREKLGPALLDPEQPNVEAWRLLGITAVALNDRSDAGFAFEAIQRLQPQYQNDEGLFTLVAELNRMGITDSTCTQIDIDRKAFLSNRADIIKLFKKMRALSPQDFPQSQGDIGLADYRLAVDYETGKGVPRNDAAAVKAYKAAVALGGFAGAMYDLGLMASNGQGGLRPDQAVNWWTSAAKAGSVEAQQALQARGIAVKTPADLAAEQQQAQEQLRQQQIQAANAQAQAAKDRAQLQDLLQDVDLSTPTPPAATQPLDTRQRLGEVYQDLQQGQQKP
jgi:TPR repeat protein